MGTHDAGDELIPLGRALDMVRLGLIRQTPTERAWLDAAWKRTQQQVEDFVTTTIKATTTAALERERDHLRRAIERSDDRAFMLRELDAVQFAAELDVEAELRRALSQDLAHTEALLEERP